MPSIFVFLKSLKSFNEVRAIVGGKRKRAITQPEMFEEILDEYIKKVASRL